MKIKKNTFSILIFLFSFAHPNLIVSYSKSKKLKINSPYNVNWTTVVGTTVVGFTDLSNWHLSLSAHYMILQKL
jgi:hypothetical protein